MHAHRTRWMRTPTGRVRPWDGGGGEGERGGAARAPRNSYRRPRDRTFPGEAAGAASAAGLPQGRRAPQGRFPPPPAPHPAAGGSTAGAPPPRLPRGEVRAAVAEASPCRRRVPEPAPAPRPVPSPARARQLPAPAGSMTAPAAASRR